MFGSRYLIFILVKDYPIDSFEIPPLPKLLNQVKIIHF